MRTKLLLTAALALIGWTNMASAADLPARTYTKAPVMPEVFNWTGFYIGANGGGMWTHNDVSNNFFDGSAIPSAQTLGALAGARGVDGSGGVGGEGRHPGDVAECEPHQAHFLGRRQQCSELRSDSPRLVCDVSRTR